MIEGEIPYSKIYFKKKKIVKKYFPDYKDTIILKDSKINLVKSKSSNTIELNGFMKTNNKFDNFNLKQIYDFKKKSFNIIGKAD